MLHLNLFSKEFSVVLKYEAIITQITKNKRSSLTFLVLGITPIICSSSITAYFISHENQIQSFSLEMWILFYLVASITMSLAITPTTYIAVVSGYFLGWVSIPFMLISYLSASLLGYFIALFIDNGIFIENLKYHQKAQLFINNLKKKEFLMIILARLSPILPFSIMNVLLAILKADIKNFIIAGFIGMLPRTLLSIFLGTQVKEISLLFSQPQKDSTNQLIIISLLIITSFTIFYFIKRMLNTNSLLE